MSDPELALAGNPNAGKTTIFNSLTGSRQHVGNWPGKTVERRSGTFSVDGSDYTVVDLPGTYSLTAASPEEAIARDYLLSGEAELVVAVVDASNLERNLYVVVQILEMGLPAVIALNMVDVADRNGVRVDVAALTDRLQTPVVPTVARTGKGIGALRAAITAACGVRCR